MDLSEVDTFETLGIDIDVILRSPCLLEAGGDREKEVMELSDSLKQVLLRCYDAKAELMMPDLVQIIASEQLEAKEDERQPDIMLALEDWATILLEPHKKLH